MKTVLQLNNLTIGYRNKVVAEGITANLNEGSLTCLVGRNGGGKSTLMRTIAQFQPALKGGVQITPHTDIAEPKMQHLVSVVLTDRVDVQNLSVREMVAMGRTPYTGFWGRMTSEDERIVSDSMQQLGVEGFADRMVHTLSDGERQKVMMAKALAQQTPLILLDEPTAFLDYPSKVETMLLLQRLCREQRKTVLISTHDLDVALRYSDAAWLLQDGCLQSMSPEEAKKVFSVGGR